MLDMLNAFYGLNLTGDGVTDLGKKVLKMERDFNKQAGFTAQHDRLPSYFKPGRRKSSSVFSPAATAKGFPESVPAW